MKKKIISALLCSLVVFSFMGCGSNNTSKTQAKEPTKEELQLQKEKEKYDYILNSDKSYKELDNEEQGVNYLYMNKLIRGETDYDSQYKDRVETLKKQKQEIDDKRNAEKKIEMDSMYSHVKVAENKDAAIKEVESLIRKRLDNSKFANKYKLTVFESFVSIDFDNSIKLSDITKGELTSITRNIYDYFTDAGLARTETEVKMLSVYFKIEDKKFTSNWELGSSPKDDWNK
ncbi:hypothetical protein [Clostridium taeniosporum]|uniref:DUF5105 domain-containing protein n=1 Tax=Clostridium taeniosporum TaxID=394958 RepID=A0A1D7XLT2_9CLOT|nr:hypothetical protein [Clostridium taeniosporum]AOR24286.1 hypothetical protein BGI42_11310 [Clostridium taeniosporum]